MADDTAAAEPKRILITGSAGQIGRLIRPELEQRGHQLRGLDRRQSPGYADAVIADLTHAQAVQAAAMGVDTIIHLGAVPDEQDFITRLLPANIAGLYHVVEAARKAKVGRLILASTVQTASPLLRDHETVTTEHVPVPANYYGATKLFAEEVGRMVAAADGMSVLAARLGAVNTWVTPDRPVDPNAYIQQIYLSKDDLCQFFTRAVESPNPPAGQFAVVFVTSRSVGRVCYDLTAARDLLGYEPKDAYPHGSRRQR